jgi:predicted nucleic acid-binding protein
VILTDAGPLVAILDRGEAHHAKCVACLRQLVGPMLTTWPAFTEAMYLLGEAGSWRAQSALWGLVDGGDLQIALPDQGQLDRMKTLMEKYKDRPMDLADASLVALAEAQGLHDIFTLDHADFRVYRANRWRSFRLWPSEL